jgi:hypothetical protein
MRNSFPSRFSNAQHNMATNFALRGPIFDLPRVINVDKRQRLSAGGRARGLRD